VTADVAEQNNLVTEPVLNIQMTPTSLVLDSTLGSTRYFPYISAAEQWSYELAASGGSYPLTKITQTSYSYDNYGNPTNISRTVTDEQAGSPFQNSYWTTTVANATNPDTSSNWCLTLYTQTQVTYLVNGSNPVTQTQQFNPDLVHCNYTQIITQANTSYTVTEALAYDGFGNVNSDTITGIGLASQRQTLTNWGSTGQFPMSVQDASGATTGYNYDFRFGLMSTQTDPNGVMTSWSYDAFGRKV
jgi:YD repeat-containing protein